jgi:hypothetical protein
VQYWPGLELWSGLRVLGIVFLGNSPALLDVNVLLSLQLLELLSLFYLLFTDQRVL